MRNPDTAAGATRNRQRAPRRRHLLAAGCLAGILLVTSAATAAAQPMLVQLPGTAGCVSETGSGGDCADGLALDLAVGVAVSPDGLNVYVVSDSDALAAFDRGPTGAITQKAGAAACISETGDGGACVDGVALFAARKLDVSPDGANVYVVSGTSDAVAVFDRNRTTGALTQKAGTAGCVSDDGTAGACVNGVALDAAQDVAASPDGDNVYVASAGSGAVAVFDRDRTTGALTQKAGTAGCISDTGTGGACADGVALSLVHGVAVSPDGRSVYAVSVGSDAVAVFDRAPSTGALTQKVGTAGCISEDGLAGTCVDGRGLTNVEAVAVSPDGKSVYAASTLSDAVAIFDRDPATGALTQKPGTAGCISETGSAGVCVAGRALDGAFDVAISPDGRTVYVASTVSDAIAVFDRDEATGALTQKAGTAGCVSETGTGGTCVDGTALDFAHSVAVSAVGRGVYVAAGLSDAVSAFDDDPPAYDVDGDGQYDALTDGLLLLRYAFGFRGATLITGAVDLANCTRCNAADIEAFIAALLE